MEVFNGENVDALMYPTSTFLPQPIGMELLGTAFSEGTLLKLAYAYQDGTDYRKAPNLEKTPDTSRCLLHIVPEPVEENYN